MSEKTKYHINLNTGRAGICRANKHECKFGGESGLENHYDSKREAEQAIVEKLSANNSSVPKKMTKAQTTPAKPKITEQDIKNAKREIKKYEQEVNNQYAELIKLKDSRRSLVSLSKTSLANSSNVQLALQEVEDKIKEGTNAKNRAERKIKEIKSYNAEAIEEIAKRERTASAKQVADMMKTSYANLASCGSGAGRRVRASC